jgi:hypothetical protein
VVVEIEFVPWLSTECSGAVVALGVPSLGSTLLVLRLATPKPPLHDAKYASWITPPDPVLENASADAEMLGEPPVEVRDTTLPQQPAFVLAVQLPVPFAKFQFSAAPAGTAMKTANPLKVAKRDFFKFMIGLKVFSGAILRSSVKQSANQHPRNLKSHEFFTQARLPSRAL